MLEAYSHHWMDIYRKNIHTFLFASEFMARKTVEFWGSNTFRLKILPNPFNARQYEASSQPGEYGLYFGRLIEEKGVDVLIEAAALVPDVPLIIVGDGPDQDDLSARVKALGLENVRMVGPKWGQELDELLNNCRFVVLPSLWYENLPYVILQSFAVGKPVIGSERGGIPELVQHGHTGLLYDSKDSDALSKAMDTLMQDRQMATQMGMNAKRFADSEFNDDRFLGRLMRVYDEVLV